MAILNDCFQELDEDGSQAIGVDELEDPLIALGLVDSRKQVEQMVHEIDDDGNIEFEEFLKLVKGGSKTKKTLQKYCNDDENADIDIIFNFFQRLTAGDLQPSKDMKIGFGIYYSQERRKKILDAIFSGKSNTMSQEGKRMIHNYKKQVDQQMARIKEERAEMAAEGRRPEPGELANYNFMTRRIQAFDRNEVDPANLKRIVDDLMANRIRSANSPQH